jgi:hypothetical protein
MASRRTTYLGEENVSIDSINKNIHVYNNWGWTNPEVGARWCDYFVGE